MHSCAQAQKDRESIATRSDSLRVTCTAVSRNRRVISRCPPVMPQHSVFCSRTPFRSAREFQRSSSSSPWLHHTLHVGCPSHAGSLQGGKTQSAAQEKYDEIELAKQLRICTAARDEAVEDAEEYQRAAAAAEERADHAQDAARACEDELFEVRGPTPVTSACPARTARAQLEAG